VGQNPYQGIQESTVIKHVVVAGLLVVGMSAANVAGAVEGEAPPGCHLACIKHTADGSDCAKTAPVCPGKAKAVATKRVKSDKSAAKK
jgi:hypothetical protein